MLSRFIHLHNDNFLPLNKSNQTAYMTDCGVHLLVTIRNDYLKKKQDTFINGYTPVSPVNITFVSDAHLISAKGKTGRNTQNCTDTSNKRKNHVFVDKK